MKVPSALVAIAALAAKASAHYVFPQLIINGVNSTDWQFIRQTNNWQNLNPVTDVTSTDIRCYTSLESGTASTTTVAAGSTVTFTIVGNPASLYHDGVLNIYMAKAPAGTDVASWDGSGQVWFKISQITAVTDGGTSITFPATELTEIPVTIPAQLPSGQYLLRVEAIGLHVASVFQGAQFYIACAQLQVTGGGTGTPGPLVAFPGEYTGMEPGILINIYWPIPTSYVQPGPPVWPAVGGSGSGSPSTSTAATSTVKSTSTVGTTTVKSTSTVGTTTVKSTTTIVSTPVSSPTGGTVAQWGQCGGQGYAGPTTCVSPFTCTVLNPFYSQCT